MASDLPTRGEDDDVLGPAADPTCRSMQAQGTETRALEADQTIARDPPGHHAVEGLVDGRHRLEQGLLGDERLGHCGNGRRTAPRLMQRGGPLIEGALQGGERRPRRDEEIANVGTVGAPSALDLPLSLAVAGRQGSTPKPQLRGEGLEG
jgi:hypothetical protein